MSGQTVEVINTDAEGRLVLADAVAYVQRNYKPTTIIDLATLTGAILVSLGHEWAGLFSNNDELASDLLTAARKSGDQLWRMPLAEPFDRLINSPIADMKNVGPREGGSITAAQFIQRFIEKDVRWAHIDMAGKAWSDKAAATYEKGATGYGVRLLDRYVEECGLEALDTARSCRSISTISRALPSNRSMSKSLRGRKSWPWAAGSIVVARG